MICQFLRIGIFAISMLLADLARADAQLSIVVSDYAGSVSQSQQRGKPSAIDGIQFDGFGASGYVNGPNVDMEARAAGGASFGAFPSAYSSASLYDRLYFRDNSGGIPEANPDFRNAQIKVVALVSGFAGATWPMAPSNGANNWVYGTGDFTLVLGSSFIFHASVVPISVGFSEAQSCQGWNIYLYSGSLNSCHTEASANLFEFTVPLAKDMNFSSNVTAQGRSGYSVGMHASFLFLLPPGIHMSSDNGYIGPVTPVPEAASLGMFLAGLALLRIRFRK